MGDMSPTTRFIHENRLCWFVFVQIPRNDAIAVTVCDDDTMAQPEVEMRSQVLTFGAFESAEDGFIYSK